MPLRLALSLPSAVVERVPRLHEDAPQMPMPTRRARLTEAVRRTSVLSSDSVASVGSKRSAWSAWSAWSVASVGSVASFGSVGSALSIASSGSILSIGSAGSILSIGATGGFLTVGNRRRRRATRRDGETRHLAAVDDAATTRTQGERT